MPGLIRFPLELTEAKRNFVLLFVSSSPARLRCLLQHHHRYRHGGLTSVVELCVLRTRVWQSQP